MRFVVAALIVSLSWVSAVPDRNVLGKQEGDVITPETQVLTGAALVDYVNKHQQLFKAEERADIGALRRKVMKSKYVNRNEKPRLDKTEDDDSKIPDSFDARIKWSHCPSISYIRDQSQCGSCWAVSAAEAMSDRACIQSDGGIQIEVSDTDILACCGESCGNGCEGGGLIEAWEYFKQYGACSGGDYGEADVCKPYVFHPCGHHRKEKYYGKCPNHMFPTPSCKRVCQSGYNKSYEKDKIYGKSAYMVPNDETLIQKEIMKNGPVQAAFSVFEDFSHYKSGIYVHTAGQQDGGHAVKLIGWGVEGGIKYWLVANSWSVDWGENGYFRILRGVNHCGIEEM
ncbi:hypothetical protein Angca_010244, partial [Angiostrongylus cantonensis]